MATGDPNTITFNAGPQPGGGALGAAPSVGQMGVQGGGAGQVGVVGNGASWFANGMTAPESNFPAFLEELAAPALARVQQQKMWDGFVAARSGQTLESIREEQPWYSKVFGPTNYEIGAQAYTVMESVSKMEQDLVTRMPELRKLPPEAMAEEFNRMTQTSMTGNVFADALMQKNFMDRAGPLLDMHTKERTAWQQDELMKAQYASNSANSSAFQAMSSRTAMLGGVRPADPEEAEKLAQSQLSLLDGLQPSKYQTDESYRAAVTNFVRGAADRNEFYTLKFLDKNGVLAALGPDAELDLRAYINGKKAEARTNYIDANPGVAEQMATVALYASEGVGAVPSQTMMDEANAAYMAATGSDEGIYSGSQMASVMAQSAGNHITRQEAVLAQRRARDEAAITDQQKRDAAEEDARAAVSSWYEGTFAQVANLPGARKSEAEALATQSFMAQREKDMAYNRARDPREPPRTGALGTLVRNANTGQGYILPGVKEYYATTNRAVLTPEANEAARQHYEEWRALKQTKSQRLDADGKPVVGNLTGATTAALYFGDETHNLFSQIESMQAGDTPFDLAYKAAMDRLQTDRDDAFTGRSRDERVAAEKRVADVIQTSFPKYSGVFGSYGNQLGKSGRQAAARSLVRAVGDSHGMLDTSEEGLAAAFTQARHKYGAEAAGKYFWENDTDDTGRPNQSVGSWLGPMDQKETGPAIEAAIDTVMRKHRLEPDPDLPVNIFRMRNTEKGEPILYVQSGTKVLVVHGADIKAEYEKRAEAARNRGTRRGVPQGYTLDSNGNMVEDISIQPK